MTQNKRVFLSFIVAMAVGTSCYRKDIRTIQLSVPKLSSKECSQHVLNALSTMEGITNMNIEGTNRILAITYDARKTAFKNIEYAISEAGFDVNDTKGRPTGKAKLPENCR